MTIEYACVNKRSSQPVIKGSRIETLEKDGEEYKELLKEGLRKNFYLQSLFLGTIYIKGNPLYAP